VVHRHWPVRPKPRNRYLKRLYHAHLMHHAVKGRRNSVSFGFLYAPSVPTLKKQLRDMRDAERAASRQPSRADLCNPSITSDLQNG
jgi:beta-carotene 3-hydroxylase